MNTSWHHHYEQWHGNQVHNFNFLSHWQLEPEIGAWAEHTAASEWLRASRLEWSQTLSKLGQPGWDLNHVKLQVATATAGHWVNMLRLSQSKLDLEVVVMVMVTASGRGCRTSRWHCYRDSDDLDAMAAAGLASLAGWWSIYFFKSN